MSNRVLEKIMQGVVEGASQGVLYRKKKQVQDDEQYTKWNMDRLSYRDKLVENGYGEEEANKLTYAAYGTKYGETPSRVKRGFLGNLFGDRYEKSDLPASPGKGGVPVISSTEALSMGRVPKSTKIISDRYQGTGSNNRLTALKSFVELKQKQLESLDPTDYPSKVRLSRDIEDAMRQYSDLLGFSKGQTGPVAAAAGDEDNDPIIKTGTESGTNRRVGLTRSGKTVYIR